MSDNLVVVATIIALEGAEAELREGLLGLVAHTVTEPGFVQYDLHVSNERPQEFMFYEIWESEEALDVHNSTPEMKAFGEKAKGWIKSVTLEKFTRIS